MASHKEEAKTTIGVVASASAVYTEASAKRFVEDAIFLYEQAIKATDELERKRFSRLASMVIPFYLECLSNYLFDDFINGKLEDVDERTDLPNTIRRFRAVYKELLNKDLIKDQDINGIRDIYTIRNKITAHPKGRSRLITTETGWERNDASINYRKFKDLPQVYSHFFPQHTKLIFTEVHDFLTKYITAIKRKLTEEQYNYIWPKELIAWKST